MVTLSVSSLKVGSLYSCRRLCSKKSAGNARSVCLSCVAIIFNGNKYILYLCIIMNKSKEDQESFSMLSIYKFWTGFDLQS